MSEYESLRFTSEKTLPAVYQHALQLCFTALSTSEEKAFRHRTFGEPWDPALLHTGFPRGFPFAFHNTLDGAVATAVAKIQRCFHDDDDATAWMDDPGLDAEIAAFLSAVIIGNPLRDLPETWKTSVAKSVRNFALFIPSVFDSATRKTLGEAALVTRDTLIDIRGEFEKRATRLADAVEKLDQNNLRTPHGFALDLELARLVEPLDSKLAEDIRDKSKPRSASDDPWETWALWTLDTGPFGTRWARLLVRSIWSRLRHAAKQHRALVYPVHADVIRIHSQARLDEDGNGQRTISFGDDAKILVTPYDDIAVTELVARGADLLGSMTAHKVLRWEITEAHRLLMRGDPNFRELTIGGGWSVFAETLNLKKKSDAQALRAILYAQRAIILTLPNGKTGNLIALAETPQRGRSRGIIEITLGAMLLPHYVHTLDENDSESRRLVPIVDLPPVVGRGNEHGQQATLSMLVVQHFRRHASELAAEGSVAINLDQWATLAMKAGLPARTITRIIDRWVNDGPDGAAFLNQPEKWRFRLAAGPLYGPAHDFIREAGDISAASSRRAREAGEKRRKRALSRGR